MDLNKKNIIEVDGVVIERLPDSKYIVELDVNGVKHKVEGYASGKMRMNYIDMIEGDKVKIQLTPYDKNKGRIVYRYRTYESKSIRKN